MSTKRKNVSKPNAAANALEARVQIKFQQAIASHQAGQFAQAQAAYEDILKVQPRHFDALHLLGALASQAGAHQQAVDFMSRAIAIHPHNPSFYSNRGVSLQELRQLEAAVASYDQAIRLKPDYALAYFNRGVSLHALGQLDAAVASYDHAVAIKPDYAEAYFSRGNTLKELKQPDAAVASYDQAIGLDPNYAEAYSNRGLSLQESGQLDAAIASYDRAISLNAHYAEAYYNRGNALKECNRLDQAAASYDNAIRLKPDYSDAYCNKSLGLLLDGNFAEGWDLYEWRWTKDKTQIEKRHFPQALWHGQESLHQKTILLHSEQGLGDTIQFARYAKLVANLGARVVLEVQAPLVDLFKGMPGVSALAIKGEPLPEFDCHCPLLSLPMVFKTALATIPNTDKYLAPDPQKLAYWASKLGEKTKPRVGLVWSGNADHQNDRNRSVLLADLMRHLPSERQYVSLQKEVRVVDRQALEGNGNILHFGDELADFTDTAALCGLMDLVISVDTSVAHLSGALGVATWVLLSFSPDWRWLLERDDSPWYPSAKLYRQPRIGAWEEVFLKVGADLSAYSP
jgi:tetratricopeptide (TPR) repeat protein